MRKMSMLRFSVVSVFVAALVLFGAGAETGARAASVNFNKDLSPPLREVPPRKPVLVFHDVPLFPALEIVQPKDELVLFGHASQDVVETTGIVDVDTIYYYYQDELPKRGWTPVNGRSFTREKMRLDIEAKSSNERGQTYVRFSLVPN